MTPDTQSKIDAIDSFTKKFELTFGSLSYETLNWKPNAEIWSVGQNIEHLILTTNSYLPVIEEIRNNTLVLPFVSRIAFFPRFFGKMIYGAVGPDRKRKSKTFPVWEPVQSNFDTSIFTQFVDSQETLKKMIVDTEDLVAAKQIIYSPANKLIVYSLEKAFEIVITHQERHFIQMTENLDLMQKGN